MPRERLRELGIRIGILPPGPENAITDVPGVLVGHRTLIRDEPGSVRTGVTVILPRAHEIALNHACAGFHSFNGNGEMTSLLWLEESGFLTSTIALTNTNQIGLVRDSLIQYSISKQAGISSRLPVIAETWDGWLSDIDSMPLTPADVFSAIQAAASGPVAEGNVGGGTGMICHEFKGGIGTASRQVEKFGQRFTVGALVQANHGDRRDLRLEGIPIGELIGPADVPLPWEELEAEGSIIVILATDAPLLPGQCKRLARRATVGFARAGGIGHNGSGDLFLAFSTGNSLRGDDREIPTIRMIPNDRLNLFFRAASEAVEEAIWNALTAAEDMSGFQGHFAHAIPLDRLKELTRRANRSGQGPVDL